MTSRKKLAVGLGVALLTLFGSLATAHAQYAAPPPYYPPPPPRGVYRVGLIVGGSLGAGVINAPNCGAICGGAFMGEVHIGGMLNPRLALMGDFWLAARGWDDPAIGSGSTIHDIATLALQYWATNILWLKGGIGFGEMRLSDVLGTFGDETGLAMMGAVGVEVLQTYSTTLDLQFRAGRGFYSGGGDVNNFALMVGFNWF